MMLSPVEHFPVLVVAISLLSAFTILIAGYLNKKSCWFISFATILVQLVMAVFILNHVLTVGTIHYWLGGWSPPWGIEYLVDALNAYVLVIILFLGLLCVIHSKSSIDHELPPHKVVFFYTVYQLFITGLCGVTVTGDIFNMYVFIEILSLAAYALVGSKGGTSLRAGFTYLVMGSIGACFFLLGIGFLYAVTGSLNIHDLSILLPSLYGNKVVQAAFIFIVVGLGIKMAIFPLHTWLPDAHPAAPSPISAMLSGIMIMVGFYALIRVLFTLFPFYYNYGLILLTLGLLSMTVGNLFAYFQNDLKRLLAYSSIVNMGIVVTGAGVAAYILSTVAEPQEALPEAASLAMAGALLHILSHGAGKAMVFLGSGNIHARIHTRELSKMGGIARDMPFTSYSMTVGLLSLLGMPPLIGFWSKFLILMAVAKAIQSVGGVVIVMTFIILLFNVIYAAAYYLKVAKVLMIERGAVRTHEAPFPMVFSVGFLGLFCLIGGLVFPIPLIRVAVRASLIILGGG
uniref:F(420)H(2) dehydrogenase subunit N n=1 Tax=Candidatus Methanophagaceae archaeon ANME-1 ERB6 TaxID=2759912 RepID=A0A7G9Z185_9EURY|nr:F(420)H(2) dehydrogenase subunit N [Methanosarcinales archaeon ANME-1 ERB6]